MTVNQRSADRPRGNCRPSLGVARLFVVTKGVPGDPSGAISPQLPTRFKPIRPNKYRWLAPAWIRVQSALTGLRYDRSSQPTFEYTVNAPDLIDRLAEHKTLGGAPRE